MFKRAVVFPDFANTPEHDKYRENLLFLLTAFDGLKGI
jgi:hypothetical protein